MPVEFIVIVVADIAVHGYYLFLFIYKYSYGLYLLLYTLDSHFVQNNMDTTGLGEPPFPPIVGTLANALYKATGNRYYHQPFFANELKLG